MSKNSLSENIKTEQQAEVFKNALNSICDRVDKNAIPRTAANIERFLAEQGIKLTIAQGSELHRLIETGVRSYAKHKRAAPHKCPMCNHDLSKQ